MPADPPSSDLASSDLDIAEQAARWVVELEEGTLEDLSELAAWLKQSPVHVEELLLVMSTWKAFDQLDPEKRVALERLLAAI
jgi:ferric-dicitrate binding protein FerR (iron transport regulator)